MPDLLISNQNGRMLEEYLSFETCSSLTYMVCSHDVLRVCVQVCVFFLFAVGSGRTFVSACCVPIPSSCHMRSLPCCWSPSSCLRL